MFVCTVIEGRSPDRPLPVGLYAYVFPLFTFFINLPYSHKLSVRRIKAYNVPFNNYL